MTGSGSPGQGRDGRKKGSGQPGNRHWGEEWRDWEKGRVITEVPKTREIGSPEQEPVSKGRSG